MNEKTITIYEFIEATCPYCRYVYYSILKDIQVRRIEINRSLIRQGHTPMPPIEIELIDIHANKGNRETQWFYNYSQKIGGIFTPAVRVGEYGKILYLWGSEKKETISGDVDEKLKEQTNKLKSEILQEIQSILTRVDKKPLLYNKLLYTGKTQYLPEPRVIYRPYGGTL